MVVLKSINEIEKMRVASRRAMEVLVYLKEFVKEGIKTLELEQLCEEKIKTMQGMKPAFKGYNGFPYCLCVSVNDEIVHGMPSERELKKGDIVSLDFGISNEGYYGDVAMTYPVGEIPKDVQRLLDVTESSLHKGINEAREGNRLYDISNAVQTHVEEAGFSIVREFVGHGIGRSLHEDPQL
ncbi:MAG TPA: type I methionyl aminopeptidase, partial [Syntrophorhabdaceae bacterium]|nr:type I methionyl aminopeptidase [Syntrophorhabdaceae bacterium]